MLSEKTISFKRKFIPNIIDKSKTLTCRLKKEGEGGKSYWKNKQKHYYVIWKKEGIKTIPKFVVDEVYQVVVDKEPVWYCPKCKEEIKPDIGASPELSCCLKHRLNEPFKSLKIKILSIREQKLLDITNADAVKEVGKGYKNPREVFFEDFLMCYYKKIPDSSMKKASIRINDPQFDCESITCNISKLAEEWNPSVWALEFEVVK